MEINENNIRRCLKDYDPSLQLGRQIGKGGTAVVYDLPGTVPAQVIKVMDTCCMQNSEGDDIQNRKKMWEYFSNEIRTMLELQECEYIMPIIATYEYIEPAERKLPQESRSYKSVFFIKMYKLQTLTSFIKSNRITESALIQMTIDICKALQVCEEKHILHRDVKPDNIFVTSNKGKLRFVLGDFGFCRRLDTLKSNWVTRCGTYAFMAPEICCYLKISGFNSDIFSLGATLFFLLTDGQFPERYYNKELFCRELLNRVSPKFADIILKAVQLEPELRYQHASEMIYALDALALSEDKQVIDKQFFLLAKQAMLNGRFSDAIQYADQGISKGETECRRLRAYCIYHEAKADPQQMQSAVMLLDELSYEGDVVAQCLRATIHGQNKEWDEFYSNIRESAEAECVIAEFLYGRALYEGWNGHTRNLEQGRNYIQKAAEANYAPALKYYKGLMKKDPHVAIPLDILYLLEDEMLSKKERLKSDIVKFL